MYACMCLPGQHKAEVAGARPGVGDRGTAGGEETLGAGAGPPRSFTYTYTYMYEGLVQNFPYLLCKMRYLQ